MGLSLKLLYYLKSLHFDQRSIWHQENYARLPSQGKILDVGCGRGAFVFNAPQRIIGLDYNFDSLTIAKEARIAHVICANATRLPFRDGSFENVHCADLIEHFNTDEAWMILKQLYRVLKKGGKLLISGPMPGDEFWCDPSHVRPYPPESLISFFVLDRQKGRGTNPTYNSIGAASVLGIYRRYRPLFRLPYQLQTDDQRCRLRNLIHPRSLLFFTGNILARVGISRFWSPAGYSLLLQKDQ